ncbi:MAG: transcription termination factor NusA, partial [Planctomycetaceae bacterium]
REAERDQLFDDFLAQRGALVNGTVTRFEGAMATVNLGKVEGVLPKSEQIPGESFRVNERVRAVVLEVRKQGTRVRIVLSRVHPDLVRRLFEIEIPEISERVIEIRSLAREAGYRSKVAVSCIDQKIDAVGACVGVRGSRIKNIVEELAGERIDIVRWNDSLQVLVPNALQPAEVEEVILCPMLGRVIVLVKEDQLSLAIGKRGQNVRLASKLVGWDIDIMTREELNEKLDKALEAFNSVPGAPADLAENLIEQGFFNFDDLSVIELDQLAELAGGLSEEACQTIVDFAEVEAERQEREQAAQKAAAHAAGVTTGRGGKPAVQREVAPAAPEAGAVAGSVETPGVDAPKVETAGVDAPVGAGVDPAAETAVPEAVEDSQLQPSADSSIATGAAESETAEGKAEEIEAAESETTAEVSAEPNTAEPVDGEESLAHGLGAESAEVAAGSGGVSLKPHQGDSTGD